MIRYWLRIFLTSITVVLLSGCGGGSVSDGQPPAEPGGSDTTGQEQTAPRDSLGKGVYLDGPVEGVHYRCGAVEGWTGPRGDFRYEIGKACTLSIGALTLRTIDKNLLNKKQVIIQETDPKISKLLLSLDIDPDPKHIRIDPVLARELNDPKYRQDLQRADLRQTFNSARTSLESKGIIIEPVRIVSDEVVVNHLQQTYQSYCAQTGYQLVENVDFLGSCTGGAGNGQTDTVPPVISLNGPEHIILYQGNRFNDPGATATDDRDGQVAVRAEGRVDTGTPGTYTITYHAVDYAGNESIMKRKVTVIVPGVYGYLPTKSEITDAMAVKFLNMATFGATDALIQELKQKGIEKWVDDQLALQYDPKQESLLRRLIRRAINIYPKTFGLDNYDTNATIPESEVDKFLANDDHCFNQRQRNGVNELDIHYSLILDTQVRFPDQIRQRVAYALSQIIIASQSNDNFFRDRGEALSYYYDLLLKHAFGNYGDLLYDVSLSPTMATFLTYANNEKEHTTTDGVKVLPDENYGREIMQLFSIGLYELNMDGTEKRVDGKRVPTYVQTDVNEMSRVFTGLTYAHSKWGRILLDGDSTHPLECYPDHHDSGEKHVLGHTLPSGQSCEQDVRNAVDLVMGHPNVAPFIAKKLIMRLTKSNPTTAYVQRVAEVFATTGGDLKATTKAVLLDPEIWENIKADKGVKFKEPYMLFTEMIRAFNFKPIPWRKHTYEKRTWIEDNPGFLTQSLYSYFGQYPTQSPSVFNFYDDAFVPDDYEFKIRGFVAPELSLYTSSYAVAMNNFLVGILEGCSIQKQMRHGEDEEKMPDQDSGSYKGTHTQTYMYVDFNEALDVMRNNGFGASLEENRGGDEETQARKQVATALVDYVAHKLIGKPLKQDKRQKLIDLYKDRPRSYNDNNNETQFRIMDFWIMPLIVDMVRSDEYMVQ